MSHNIVSYNSREVREIINQDINIIENNSLLTLISDGNKLKELFDNYHGIAILRDFNAIQGKLVIDVLNDIQYYIVLQDVYVNENIYTSLKSTKANKIYRKDPLDIDKNIYREAIKVICNKILRQIHSDNILYLNFTFNKEVGIKDNQQYILSQEERIFIERTNSHLEMIVNIFKENIPGLKVINIENGIFIKDIGNREFLIDREKVEDINCNIRNFLKEDIKFKGEKIHSSNNGIKYLFKKAKYKNRDRLIIVFSAFSSKDAKYNYINTLNFIDCNKLYILDDYGTKGSYYIGLDGKLDIETSVASLISKIMSDENITFKNVISIGSSKGGSAALYYGMKYNYGHIIIGAPQYKIGTYLSDLSIKTYGKEIFGEINAANRIKYNNLIRLVCNSNSKVHLLTSDGDSQYHRVLKEFELVADELNIKLNLEKCLIKNHNEIAKEFPIYLNKELTKLLNLNKYQNMIAIKLTNFLKGLLKS